MKRLGVLPSIRLRILLVALLPASVMALALSVYVISARLDDLNQAFAVRSQALAEQLATAAIYGVFTADREHLQLLCRETLQRHSDIRQVHIVGPDGTVYAEAAREDGAAKPLPGTIIGPGEHPPVLTGLAHSHRFEAPIRQASPSGDIDDIDDIASSGPTPATIDANSLGRVVLLAGDGNVHGARWSIVRNASLLALVGLSLAGLFAAALSARIARPVLRLTEALARVRGGELGIQVPEDSAGEIGALERGFNAMTHELASANEQLHQQVEQATGDLRDTMEALEIRNAELDLARRRALDAIRVKSDFLANMSHEIRTPMNGIVGFTNLLAKTPLDGTQRQFVETIAASATNLLSIINDILDFSKLESGKVILEREPFSLRAGVDEAVALLAPQAHEKHLELVSMVYDDVPDCLIGDVTRVGQILTNLLSNAIKFTAAGEVVLRVMLHEERDDEVELMCTVTDTGIGVPADEQERLFSAFQQGSATTKRRYGGTGLGLSICRSLASAMDGTISVSSREGQGSCFRVTLTVGRGRAPEHKSSPLFPGRRALLIDSHPLSRIMLRNTLGGLGLIVEDYEKLPDRRAGGDQPPDLVAIAATGGSEDLLAMEAAIRHARASYAAPLFALLSSSDQELVPRLLAAGATRCLSKPVRRLQLVEALTTCFKRELAPASQPVAAAGGWAAGEWLSGRLFLVADDNAINLRLMDSLLTYQGASVLKAADGAEAVRLALAHPVDLVFMDVHMPKLNGLDAAREIRAAQGGRRIPIVALTADAAPQNREAMQRARLDGVLIKPLQDASLHALIARVLDLEPLEPREDPLPSAPDAPSAERRSLPLRDMTQALRIAGESQSVADKLFNELLAELPGVLMALQDAYAEQQWHELWQLAHRLHGSAAVCGVPALHAAVGDLQAVVRTAEVTKIAQALANVQQQAGRLVSENW